MPLGRGRFRSFLNARKIRNPVPSVRKKNKRMFFGTRLVLLALLLGIPFCAQARMQCDNQAGVNQIRPSTTNNFAIEHYRFDVVPCAEEKQDRSNIDNEARIKKAGEEATSFITWIAAKTGWTISKAPPVHFISSDELVNTFTGGKPTTSRVEALYSDENHSIYLPDGWRADDLRDRSILLHELVHHLQYLNRVEATCASEHELQAVKLQVTWLREQGAEDPLGLLGINDLFIRMLGQCE